ncbi:MAG: (4Fe-4S)-binding protein [Nitrosopumilus sp.]|nr:(4Fe-4S)-binding protein [Nitrososphaerota archaeon]
MNVTWDENICIHSAKCIKNLPSVFTKQDGKFIIIQDGAPEDQIRKVVKECPSAALKIEE